MGMNLQGSGESNEETTHEYLYRDKVLATVRVDDGSGKNFRPIKYEQKSCSGQLVKQERKRGEGGVRKKSRTVRSTHSLKRS